jgi:hypothetical protein
MTLLPVLLPEGYTSKVSVNDKLAAGDTIAILTSGNKETLENTVNVAFYFNVPSHDITKFLKKNLGDAISEGEVLAEKKGGLGKSAQKLISQFSGTITKIDQTNGDVGVRSASGNIEPESSKTIISPVAGTVDFCNNEKIVIKTDRDAILALDGLGEEAQGEVISLGELEETELNSEMAGKIILADSVDKVSLFKAIGLDAIGIVIKSLEDTDFIDLEQKRITVPVMIVSEEDYKKLARIDKKHVFLGGKDKTIVIL